MITASVMQKVMFTSPGICRMQFPGVTNEMFVLRRGDEAVWSGHTDADGWINFATAPANEWLDLVYPPTAVELMTRRR